MWVYTADITHICLPVLLYWIDTCAYMLFSGWRKSQTLRKSQQTQPTWSSWSRSWTVRKSTHTWQTCSPFTACELWQSISLRLPYEQWGRNRWTGNWTRLGATKTYVQPNYYTEGSRVPDQENHIQVISKKMGSTRDFWTQPQGALFRTSMLLDMDFLNSAPGLCSEVSGNCDGINKRCKRPYCCRFLLSYWQFTATISNILALTCITFCFICMYQILCVNCPK